MARFTSKYANPEFPVGSYAGGRVMQAAYGHMKAPAGVANADVLAMCKVPFGALILSAAVLVDGVAVDDAVIGWDGTPGALTTIEAPVAAPRLDASPDVSGGGDVVITYTVATADAVAAGDDVYVLVTYVYEQPKP